MSRIVPVLTVVLVPVMSMESSAAAKTGVPAKTSSVVMAKVVTPVTKFPSISVVSLAPEKERGMLYAVGEGAMPTAKEQPNRAKAYLQAKAYAKMAAIASLLQSVKGTMICYRSEGRGYIADTQIKEEINGALEAVQVVSARKRAEGKDTIVEVTVRAPKPLPPQPPVEKPAPKPPPDPLLPTWAVASAASDGSPGGHTSLVIDAKGLRVDRSMSPRILRPDGSEVWGTVKADPDFITEHGIAAYARSRGDALASKRAGPNPLVIRAVGRGRSVSGSDIVVSDSDASRILSEDRRTGFLKDFRVIVIVD